MRFVPLSTSLIESERLCMGCGLMGLSVAVVGLVGLFD